jgi:hypothetical protein
MLDRIPAEHDGQIAVWQAEPDGGNVHGEAIGIDIEGVFDPARLDGTAEAPTERHPQLGPLVGGKDRAMMHSWGVLGRRE